MEVSCSGVVWMFDQVSRSLDSLVLKLASLNTGLSSLVWANVDASRSEK